MKKRENSAKRAVRELFSNSTDEIKYSEGNGIRTNSKRDELKKQFFGTSSIGSQGGEAVIDTRPRFDSDTASRGALMRAQITAERKSGIRGPVGASCDAAVISGKKTAEGKLKCDAAVISVEKTAEGKLKNESAKYKSPEIKTAKKLSAEKKVVNRRQNGVPVTNGRLKGIPALQGESLSSAAANTSAAEKSTPDAFPTDTADAACTLQPRKLHVKKRAAVKLGGFRIAIVALIMTFILAVSVTAAVYLFPDGENFVPADINAGESDRLSTAQLLSGAAYEYLTQSRYSVSFKFYESPDITCTTPEITVGELMDKLGISLEENNRMYVSLDDKVTESCDIAIDTLSYETAYATESVPYETEYEDIRTIPKGTTSVKVNGKNGEKKYTYKCTLVNGVEESRELVGEEITVKPTSRVLYRGVGGTVNSQGKTYNYSYYIDVKATTYHIYGNTATGMTTSESVMAVDPSVIPLYSKCVVKGSYGDFGYRVAADTGGAIKGNKIDIWLPADSPYSGNFGWRSMRVYILG